MTDKIKITDLDELTAPSDGDWVPVVDISDTTQSADGTTKKVTKAKLKGLNWEGTWAAGTYTRDDAVENDGSAWVCIASSTTEEPSGVATDWDLLASKGDTGSTGATGSTGSQGIQGEKGLNWQGAWSAGTYQIDDAVEHNGSSWVAIAVTTQEPSGAASEWDLLAEKGADGLGSGDMSKATYDPTNINGSAFNRDNHIDGTTYKGYSASEKTKLAGIETAADVTDAGNVGAVNAAATSKATPVDADSFPIVDSEASNVIKRVTGTNLKAFLKTYIDAMTSTFTNKRVNPRTASSTTASSLTPDLSAANIYYRTTQTATLTINAPIGTPVIGETIAIYVDSAGAQTLTINSTYKAFGAAFPAATTAGKTFLMTAQFNGTDWKTTWANAV